MPDCADDGSLLAIIDDDIGLPIEVCLIDGIFIAARGGFSFFETRRFEDMIAALNQEIERLLEIERQAQRGLHAGFALIHGRVPGLAVSLHPGPERLSSD